MIRVDNAGLVCVNVDINLQSHAHVNSARNKCLRVVVSEPMAPEPQRLAEA